MTYQLLVRSAHDTGLEPESVDCVIFSPPYWKLRKYKGQQGIEWGEMSYAPMADVPEITIPGWQGDLGAEPTPAMFIGHLMLVMAEMWRVLKPWGTVYVNLGDTYSGSGGAHKPHHKSPGLSKSAKRDGYAFREEDRPDHKKYGLKEKSMVGIPWRFFFAAQAQGWIMRRDIVWAKGVSFMPNYAGSSKPESVLDRPTTTHEYVFQMAKSPRYYFDMEAVKEDAKDWGKRERNKGAYVGEGVMPNGQPNKGFKDCDSAVTGRHLRSVWVINPAQYKESHYATWPVKLVEPMIKASTSQTGNCPKCGKPWIRQTTKKTEFMSGSGQAGRTAEYVNANGKWAGIQHGVNLKLGPVSTTATTGWVPSCACDAGDPVPATILDPFSGSATTGEAALRLGRNYIGLDISEEYATVLAPKRLNAVQMVLV